VGKRRKRERRKTTKDDIDVGRKREKRKKKKKKKEEKNEEKEERREEAVFMEEREGESSLLLSEEVSVGDEQEVYVEEETEEVEAAGRRMQGGERENGVRRWYAAESFWRSEVEHCHHLQELFQMVQKGRSPHSPHSPSSLLLSLIQQCFLLSSDLCLMLEGLLHEKPGRKEIFVDKLTSLLGCEESVSLLKYFCLFCFQFGPMIEDQLPCSHDHSCILKLLTFPAKRITEWKTHLGLLLTSPPPPPPSLPFLSDTSKEMLFQAVREIESLSQACSEAEQEALMSFLDV